MSTVTSWRERRQAARNRRAINRAIDTASTPAMRHELMALASNGSAFLR